jgi:polygalacturonase
MTVAFQRVSCIFRLYFFPVSILIAQQNTSTIQGWDALPGLLKRISQPVFPDKGFNITKYGAVGDGKTDCTKAFKKAIEKCHASGGGRVVVPKGIYVSAAIHLKSNVNLYLSKDAIIKFSIDPKKYLPIVYTRWEGVECMNYSPLIYAYEEENIAVTGEGILDGQGANDNWWRWKGKKEYGWIEGQSNQNEARKKLLEMGEKGIPVAERVFGEGSYLRPNFFVPYKCNNVLVEGVTFKNSPMWFINPVLCRNVTVSNVKIEGLGPNNDGCDPESCTDVLIKDCYFDNGDDCIAIKSGRNADGRRIGIPCENVVIQGCKIKEGHGGVVIGSEMSGGVRNVYIENCVMDSPNLDRALRIKTNSVRGGIVENVFMRNITVEQVTDAIIKIDYYYEEGDSGEFTPVVRNIEIDSLISKKSKYAVWICAYKRSPLTNLRIQNSCFDGVEEPYVIENISNISIINVKINGK